MPKKRQTPYRPRSDKDCISQPYSDGVVKIYNVTDTAAPGIKPRQSLEVFATLCYAERKLGLTRYYAAKQNQIEVKRVLRVPKLEGIHTQQVAVTEDCEQYRIDLVQLAADVYPPSWDITLAKVEQKFKLRDMEASYE